ncbi:hypothetical protein TRFO_39175 [Tritrichomonas foetus]|uniref:C2 NT-type domain-containing protein n=1 Tax=Tritrichomonas foetus TaxID=1144522 RepID=A0A1J4JBN6_9EUKA|nr:hypothetical protein TRFO_39175 [Tritrichomonas foetus]|eukprot:OHS94660.1 hypothetical protein TRFO_39175 [Tritrichomonas foetus]
MRDNITANVTIVSLSYTKNPGVRFKVETICEDQINQTNAFSTNDRLTNDIQQTFQININFIKTKKKGWKKKNITFSLYKVLSSDEKSLTRFAKWNGDASHLYRTNTLQLSMETKTKPFGKITLVIKLSRFHQEKSSSNNKLNNNAATNHNNNLNNSFNHNHNCSLNDNVNDVSENVNNNSQSGIQHSSQSNDTNFTNLNSTVSFKDANSRNNNTYQLSDNTTNNENENGNGNGNPKNKNVRNKSSVNGTELIRVHSVVNTIERSQSIYSPIPPPSPKLTFEEQIAQDCRFFISNPPEFIKYSPKFTMNIISHCSQNVTQINLEYLLTKVTEAFNTIHEYQEMDASTDLYLLISIFHLIVTFTKRRWTPISLLESLSGHLISVLEDLILLMKDQFSHQISSIFEEHYENSEPHTNFINNFNEELQLQTRLEGSSSEEKQEDINFESNLNNHENDLFYELQNKQYEKDKDKEKRLNEIGKDVCKWIISHGSGLLCQNIFTGVLFLYATSFGKRLCSKICTAFCIREKEFLSLFPFVCEEKDCEQNMFEMVIHAIFQLCTC